MINPTHLYLCLRRYTASDWRTIIHLTKNLAFIKRHMK